MAEIPWKSKDEEENKSKPPTLEERLLNEIEQLREEKKMTDLALLELVDMVLGGDEGGE